MRWLGRLVAALVAVAAVLVGVAYLLPREVTVTRDTVIEAPRGQVFPHLNSLQKVAEWSPWSDMDPDMRVEFAGPEQGPGNRMTWSSADPAIGEGSQEIIASLPDQRVETALDIGGMGIVTSWLVLRPDGDGTRVTWGLEADMGNAPVGRYMGLMMDQWVGGDFEAGLARLKALVEAE
jgi:Polyketide cyclase / dehydrase and lipid transport